MSLFFFLIIIVIIVFIRTKGFCISFFWEKGKKIKEISEYCIKNNIYYSNEQKKHSEVFDVARLSSLVGDPVYGYYHIMSGVKENISFTVFNMRALSKPGVIVIETNFGFMTICALNKSGWNIPDFNISSIKEGWYELVFKNLIEVFNFKEVKFDNDIQFSNRFHLLGNDVQKVKDFFDINVRGIFKQIHSKDIIFECRNNYFFVVKKGFLNIDERLNMLTEALKVYISINSKKQ